MELDRSRKISTRWPVHWSVASRASACLPLGLDERAESHLKRATQQPTLKSYLPLTLASELDSPTIHFKLLESKMALGMRCISKINHSRVLYCPVRTLFLSISLVAFFSPLTRCRFQLNALICSCLPRLACLVSVHTSHPQESRGGTDDRQQGWNGSQMSTPQLICSDFPSF